jgi:hypothetical protein
MTSGQPRLLPEESLLLRIAVGPDAEAKSLWEHEPVEIERAPESIFAALPPAYRRISAAGATGPQVERLKGVYRSCWTRNQLRRAWLVEMLQALTQIGAVPVLLGGMRLATGFYDELALRPVIHVELVVEDFDAAAQALRSDVTAKEPDRIVFARSDEVVGVVRRRLPPELVVCPRKSGAGGPRPLAREQLDGHPVFVLDPLDELLVAAVGPAGRTASGRLQALLDIHTLATAPGRELDWLRFATEAGERALSYRALDALTILRDETGMPVPEDALVQLASSASTPLERAVRVLEARGRLRAAERVRTSGITQAVGRSRLTRRSRRAPAGAV